MKVKIGPYDVPGYATGDCRALMGALPEGCVQAAITSPPYWGLRKYAGNQDTTWADGSTVPFGNETTPEEYVTHTVEVLAAIRRVLREDGVCFWNVGDSYYNNASNQQTNTGQGGPHGYGSSKPGRHNKALPHPTLKQKDLCLIPWRVAIAAQADGWYVRSVIAWTKTNPMPESVTDRPTSAWEPILMLTKSERYFWDAEAVREGMVKGAAGSRFDAGKTGENGQGRVSTAPREDNPAGRNIRNVWAINSEPYREAHFACFPSEIPRRCIKAATPDKCCAACGEPWVRVAERSGGSSRQKGNDWQEGHATAGHHGPSRPGSFVVIEPRFMGIRPNCACNADTRPALVLDPFCGSGTTCMVAEDLGRLWLGFDISEDYRKLQSKRTEQASLMGALLTGGRP